MSKTSKSSSQAVAPSRREFLGAMGMTGLVAATATQIAWASQGDTADANNQSEADASADGETGTATTGLASTAGAAPQESIDLTGWTGTPDAISAVGNSTMPLAELNRRRQAYLDQQTEHTCEDGTVIPDVYVKMAALINTYGFGGAGRSNYFTDEFLHYMMNIFSEDEAQAYLDMPWGQQFSAYDMNIKTGIPMDECTQICDHFASEGFIERWHTDNGVKYNQIAFIVGVLEYQIPRISDYAGDPSQNILLCVESDDEHKAITAEDFLSVGTPPDYTIPCDASVVADDEVLACDDIEKIIRSKSRFAITPCYCRYSGMVEAGVDCPSYQEFVQGGLEDYFSPVCDQRVETCLALGHLADFYIDRGLAREITMDQALEYMQRSVEDGFILQSIYSAGHEGICSCHADSCKLFRLWNALGDPAKTAATPAFQQVSHYLLQVDLDACIGCGTCAQRCPAHAITMDEQSGKPVVNEMCFRCGQCAVTCPVEARKLTARPAELNATLPATFLDDHNDKAGYRFEHGLVR